MKRWAITWLLLTFPFDESRQRKKFLLLMDDKVGLCYSYILFIWLSWLLILRLIVCLFLVISLVLHSYFHVFFVSFLWWYWLIFLTFFLLAILIMRLCYENIIILVFDVLFTILNLSIFSSFFSSKLYDLFLVYSYLFMDGCILLIR